MMAGCQPPSEARREERGVQAEPGRKTGSESRRAELNEGTRTEDAF